MSKTSGLTITLNHQSAANNTSNITVYGYIKCNSGSFRTNKTLNWYITINGTKITTTGTSSVGTTKASGSLTTSARAGSSSTSYYTNVMVDWTGNVSHDSSGACTVKAHFDFYGDWVSETTTKTLTAIPQAATLTSVTNTTAGGVCTCKFTPRNTTYRYKITFSCGNVSFTAPADSYITASSTDPISYSYTMEVSKWHPAIPNSKTGTVTATLKTYNGNTQVGSSSSKTFTLTANSNYKPFISSVSNAIVNGYSTYYLRGKSSVKVTIDASMINGTYPEPSGGATIASYAVKIGDTTYTSTSNEVTSNVLTATSYTVSVTVTDTRGNTTTANGTNINTTAYSNPTITGSIYRSDGGGNASPTLGTYAKIDLTIGYTNVGNNAVSTVIKYTDGTNEYTYTGNNNLVSGISASNKYVFIVSVTDSAGSKAEAIYTIPSSFMLLHFNTAGHGMAIGGGNTVDRTVQSYLPLRTKYGITYDNGGEFYNSTINAEQKKVNPSRLSSANLAGTGIAGMHHFIAHAGMTDGSIPNTTNGNGHVIHFEWDNYGWNQNEDNPVYGTDCYNSQLFIPHTSTASRHMAFRGTGGGANDNPWSNSSWKELIDTGGGQLTSLMAVHSVSIDNLTINSDSYLSNQTKSAALTGYTPLCIVGWYIEAASTNGTLNSWVFPYRLEISGNKLIVSLRNTSTSGAAKVKVTADVLYLKN